MSRGTAHEQVYTQLRIALMAAKFAPGDKLTVRRIAREFGVSPMPVRAALVRLQAEKAIVQNHSGTMQIPRITREQCLNLLQLRALLEGQAAEMAAKVIRAKELARLERLAKTLTVSDATNYVIAHRNFRFAVVGAARSEALRDLVERLWLQIAPVMRFVADVRGQGGLDRYEEVVEALRSRDGPAARAAIEQDTLKVRDLILGRCSNFRVR